MKAPPMWLFPTVLIVLQLASAVVYGCQGDWRRVGYWISGAAITVFVTF
jgi:hypothetical protein